MRTLFQLLVVLVFSAVCFANTINVPTDQPTIQAGIDAAVNGDTVLVAPGTYEENIDIIGKAITVISSDGAENTVIDGGNPLDPDFGSVVTFSNGEGLDSVLDGFTLINGFGTYFEYSPGAWGFCGGGILCSESSPMLMDNKIIGNSSEDYGGGVYCFASSPTLTNNTITGNTIEFCGGGIYIDHDTSPTLTDNTIIGNKADRDGGGIYCNSNSSPIIVNNTVTENKAIYFGGGIYFHNDTFPTFTNNTIKENTAGNGGGIYCSYSSSLTLANNTIKENTAGGNGGGIYCYSKSSPTLINNTIIVNTAGSNGGGICFYNAGGPLVSSPTLMNNTIKENTAGGDGGGIYCYWSASPTLSNNTIQENTAGGDGGGICCSHGSSAMLTNDAIAGNAADDDGGGIYCYMNSSATLTNITITGNTAAGDGGGICCVYGTSLTLENNTISGNTANVRGGGVDCMQSSALTLTNTILWDNTAPTGPEMRIGISSNPSTLTISHSNVKGGQTSVYVDPGCTLNWGAGMIDADPRFIPSENGLYYLSQTASGQANNSPCIDVGSDLASNLGMDTLWTRTDGNVDTGTVDMGFHYGPFATSWTAPLYPDAYVLPETTGGSVNFYLNAGTAKANRKYILLGGVSGTEPGFPLPGGNATLPINWDVFTDYVVLPLINTSIFSNFMGTLDGNGQCTAQFNAPPVTGYAGIKMYYAYCLGWPWEFASNPAEIEVVP